ncbi:xanthine dehydrogenase accessory protein XdhC [Archangium minus]|uniref:Xanthine dehydrogenase accessory protein XdhC n=2 Tax=Archangium minus TaxID=83450 RepID=A0ABY9XC80_9BACT|nr:xanthine dehydrogenase accessory protein XdhC [Archangium minus]
MDLYAEMAALVSEGRPFVLATVIESAGSTPQKPGSKLVVLEDGSLRGTVGGGAIEHQIIQAAQALLASPEHTRIIETHLTHELGMCCGGRMKVFLEKHGAPPRLTVFGAGHVARELASLAHRVGFRVTVVDARPEWANPERFPDCELLVKDPADHARALPGGPEHYFCVTTHDHPLDQAVVEALLDKPSAYLGVIGSRRKAERFRMRLRAAGFTEPAVERLRSPMGVDIGALTPQEIAVSIVGELIQVRRQSE